MEEDVSVLSSSCGPMQCWWAVPKACFFASQSNFATRSCAKEASLLSQLCLPTLHFRLARDTIVMAKGGWIINYFYYLCLAQLIIMCLDNVHHADHNRTHIITLTITLGSHGRLCPGLESLQAAVVVLWHHNYTRSMVVPRRFEYDQMVNVIPFNWALVRSPQWLFSPWRWLDWRAEPMDGWRVVLAVTKILV